MSLTFRDKIKKISGDKLDTFKEKNFQPSKKTSLKRKREREIDKKSLFILTIIVFLLIITFFTKPKEKKKNYL